MIRNVPFKSGIIKISPTERAAGDITDHSVIRICKVI